MDRLDLSPDLLQNQAAGIHGKEHDHAVDEAVMSTLTEELKETAAKLESTIEEKLKDSTEEFKALKVQPNELDAHLELVVGQEAALRTSAEVKGGNNESLTIRKKTLDTHESDLGATEQDVITKRIAAGNKKMNARRDAEVNLGKQMLRNKEYFACQKKASLDMADIRIKMADAAENALDRRIVELERREADMNSREATMASHEQEVKEREAEIKNARDEVASRVSQVAKRESVLKAAESTVANKEKYLYDARVAVATREQTVKDLEASLAKHHKQFEAEMREREVGLADHASALKAFDSELKAKEDDLLVKQALLNCEMEEREKFVQLRETHVAEREANSEKWENEQAEMEKNMARAQAFVERQQILQDIRAKRQQDAYVEFDKRHKDLEKLFQHLAIRENNLRHRKQQQRRRLAQLQTRIITAGMVEEQRLAALEINIKKLGDERFKYLASFEEEIKINGEEQLRQARELFDSIEKLVERTGLEAEGYSFVTTPTVSERGENEDDIEADGEIEDGEDRVIGVDVEVEQAAELEAAFEL